VTARTALVGAALALAFAAIFVFRAAEKMPDFEVYVRSGARALAAEPLYQDADGHYQHKYLPAFAIAAIPAALLPMPVAKAVWFALSSAALVTLVGLSLRLLRVRHKPAWLLVVATVVCMAKFYGHELVLGQVNVMLATLLVAAVHLARSQHGVLAGALVAAAVMVKPYALIFLPWLAARRDWRAIGAALAGIAIGLALPVVGYGIDGTIALHAAWWRTVAISTPPNLLNADNVSLAGMYAKWLGIGSTSAALAAATALALLAAAGVMLVSRRHVAAPDGLDASFLLMLIPLISPQGWDYVLLVSTPAVMHLVNHDRDLPPAIRAAVVVALALMAFSLYDVMGRRAYRVFMDLSVITVCSLVLAGGLLTLRLRRVA
jgi:hypothetical protein